MSLGAREREGVALIDPRQMGNLEAWYDAEYVNGFGGATPANGNRLPQWNDLSGNNRHVLQASPLIQPTFRTPRAAGVVNAAPNPRLTVNSVGWNTNNGTLYTVSRDPANGHLTGASAACVNLGAAGTGASIGSLYVGNVSPGNNQSIAVTPGKAYHISVWAKVNRSALMNVQIPVRNASAATLPSTAPVSSKYGTLLSGANLITGPANVPLAANTWAKFDIVTGLMPAGAETVLISVSAATNPLSATGAAGDTLWCTKALVEEWPSDGQYMDGDTGAGFGWSGTANQSPTVRLVGDPTRVQFDGLYGVLTQPTNTLLYPTDTPLSVYAVVSGGVPNASNSNSRIAAVGTAVGFYYGTNSTLWGPIINGAIPANKAASPGQPHIFFGKGTLTQAGAAVDGSAQVVAALTPRPLNGAINVGSTGPGGAAFAGDISSLLIFSEAHDEQRRHRVEQWLAARYKVPMLRP